MKNFGIKVNIKFVENSLYEKTEILRNITEIHYNYSNGLYDGDNRIAFESDIHSSGCTYSIKDILEFETSLETNKAKHL